MSANRRSKQPSGLSQFARRLAHDNRGNTLAMMAAALIPLLGMVGSGLDLSRAYLTKAKLQSACDASALATRRAMAANLINQTSIDEGKKFFKFNFPDGTMEAAPVDLVIQAKATDASTVEVKASTKIPTAVMKVFGIETLSASVACSADQDYVNNDIMLVLDVTGSMNCAAGTSCDYAATEQSNSRLSRLRNATGALYRALDGATGVRTRYGFMPYSMTVNVGRDLQQTWLTNPANYWQKSGSKWTSKSINHDANWFANTWSGCVEERSTMSQGGTSIRISPDVAQSDIDVTSAMTTQQWQPYDDVATVGETGAYTNLAAFCPARARRLATYASESAFQTQALASLTKVGGYTNHDLGLMWAARYLSSTGMFSSDNPTTLNQMPVEKHIIFLTDGVMTADDSNYSSFGVPEAEDRMTSGSSLVQKHQARFQNACNRARQMGMTIWVIALDVQSPDSIRPCASGNDHFFVSNGSDLETVFTRIGKGIGRLRMTT